MLNVQLEDTTIRLLDHGYVKYIEHWGSDEMIVECARMSTAKGFLGWGPNHDSGCTYDPEGDGPVCKCPMDKPGDEKLLRFLWENKHSTPFEFGGLTIEVQATIMAFREWHRHRTQSYAERSARYTPLPDFNYMPTTDRLMVNVGQTKNRQTAAIDGAAELTLDSALEWLTELADSYEVAERCYQSGLRRGVPKELARLPVPVGRYTVMRATTDLRNWLGFAQLRLAKGAQLEIRVFAEAVHSILTDRFPRTLALFDETRPA